MMNIKQLVLASHNAGKLKELQAMLGESVQLRSIGEWSKVEPEETGLSFVENAILKARNAARISGLPALAVQYQDGKIATVWPKEQSSAPVMYPAKPFAER